MVRVWRSAQAFTALTAASATASSAAASATPPTPTQYYRKHNYLPLYSNHVDLRLMEALLARERAGCAIAFRRVASPEAAHRASPTLGGTLIVI